MAADALACIGLGANLGDPPRQIGQALDALSALPETQLESCSSLYRSAPQGPQDQPDFCNAVCRLATRLEPLSLLDALQAIERQAGRERGEHWGPRVLDLDLLLFGDLRLDDARLTLPHPWLHRRRFVLQPLLEIVPDVVVPGAGPAEALLNALPGPRLGVWADSVSPA